jgi:ribosomal protein S12 methylthiotransferase
MKRGHTKREIEYIINTFRKEIPEVSIRTTVITGFPGETDADYLELKEFIKQTQFDRMGVFKYSHEEGTPAFDLDDDVPEDTREERMNELMSIQEKISLSANLAKVGKSLKVLVDRKEDEFYIARTEFDSPEVDNEVLIPAGDTKLHPGNFYKVEIFDALEFDLYGRPVE